MAPVETLVIIHGTISPLPIGLHHRLGLLTWHTDNFLQNLHLLQLLKKFSASLIPSLLHHLSLLVRGGCSCRRIITIMIIDGAVDPTKLITLGSRSRFQGGGCGAHDGHRVAHKGTRDVLRAQASGGRHGVQEKELVEELLFERGQSDLEETEAYCFVCEESTFFLT